MHLGCQHGRSHVAVKLLRPRASPACLVSNVRSFSTPPSRRYIPNPPDPEVPGHYVPCPSPNLRAQNIAVLGGGITGLATAFNLSKDIPDAKITIFEERKKLGGWVESEQIEVDDGKVLFEWGPRTLRPDIGGNGKATLQLINRLPGLSDSIRGIPFSHPAATNRYIYYPDHLVRLPGYDPSVGIIGTVFRNVRTILSEPAFKGAVRGLFREPTIECRPANQRDESVGSFVSRRFGPAITDNLLSALFHGIYAGDIYKLSARTLLPKLWYLENRDADGNGVLTEMGELTFRQFSLTSFDTVRFQNRFTQDDKGWKASFDVLLQQMRATSVYTFVKGIGQLTDALLDNLRQNPNVTFASGTSLRSLAFDASNRKFSVGTSSGTDDIKYDYTISTLRPDALTRLLTPAESSTSASTAQSNLQPLTNALAKSPGSVNVMVVNLYYPTSSLPVDSNTIPRGFGYLLPRSVPVEQNPERALGVIFGSETAGPRGPDAMQKVVKYPELREEQQEQLAKIMDTKRYPDGSFTGRYSVGNEDAIKELEEKYNKAVEELSGEKIEKTIQMGQDTASGTKITVMMGGHWWEGWRESDLPSEDEAVEMAKTVLARHLGLDAQPLLAKAVLQQKCIPQYRVGCRDNFAQMHKEMLKAFEGRLKVAGSWWQGGVGLNDCVKSAREVSRSVREAWDQDTGLQGWDAEEKWILTDRRSRKSVFDPLQRM